MGAGWEDAQRLRDVATITATWCEEEKEEEQQQQQQQAAHGKHVMVALRCTIDLFRLQVNKQKLVF